MFFSCCCFIIKIPTGAFAVFFGYWWDTATPVLNSFLFWVLDAELQRCHEACHTLEEIQSLVLEEILTSSAGIRWPLSRQSGYGLPFPVGTAIRAANTNWAHPLAGVKLGSGWALSVPNVPSALLITQQKGYLPGRISESQPPGPLQRVTWEWLHGLHLFFCSSDILSWRHISMISRTSQIHDLIFPRLTYLSWDSIDYKKYLLKI